MKNVILAGNATTADILNCYLEKDDRYNVVGLTVDDEFADKGGIAGLETVKLSKLSGTFQQQDHVVIMAMGYNDLNQSRESLFLRLKDMGYQIETYVHPDAHVYTNHPLGEGCIILPSAIIEPQVQIGANTMIWSNVTVAHHSQVDENCWLASGSVISGQACVKRNSFIGVNATVVNEVVIEEKNIIGGGVLVTKNTKPSSVHLARSGEEHRFSSEDYSKYLGV